VSISGFTADGRLIIKYLRLEWQKYKYMHNSLHPLNRLVEKLSAKAQLKTMK